MINSKISGVGYFVPDNVVKNSHLEKMMNTTDEWIRERTGIEERRWVNDQKLTTSLMGTYAAENAISDAGIQRDDIDFIMNNARIYMLVLDFLYLLLLLLYYF